MKPILPKHRKSQLTVFLLLGLVLVLVVGFAFLAAKRPGPDTVPTDGSESLKLFVESCLKIATLDAMHEHGLDPGISTPLIEGYVTSHMPSCLNHFSTYREEGYEITEGEMTVDAVINSEALTVDLDFPITLKDQDSVIQFERASYQFPRKIMTTINPGAETVVTSDDRRIVLVIPAGTEATLDGEPLERVGIEVLDREFDGNSNSVLAGMLAFAGIPHGATFSQPVTLIHFYDERDVPSTIPEENVRLGFWSAELGTWVGLPTNVDDEQHILTATTTHFSPYGAVLRCTTDEDNIMVFHAPVLVKHDCEECDAEGWTVGDAPKGVGDFWIKSEEITRGHSAEAAGTVRACSDEGVKRKVKVNTCSDSDSDCEGECTGEVDGLCPADGCDCEETYFYYSEAEFTGTAEVVIEFAGNGDSCIGTDPSIGTGNLFIPTQETGEGETQQTALESFRERLIRYYLATNFDTCNVDEYDVCITPYDCSSSDTCKIIDYDFDQSTLTFTLEVTNGGDTPDACLQGGASVHFGGFGIQSEGSYYKCIEGSGDREVSYIGGKPDDRTLSVCTCEGDGDNKVCRWTIDEVEEQEDTETEGSTIPSPAAGTVITGDGTDAESRRERDKCPEGDKEPQEYDTCPDDFEDTYLDKRFTFKGVDDTRDMKFCDLAGGDYPEMHHNDRLHYSSNTELLVFGSAMRKDRCWLLVEAQQCLEGTNEKPDFYIEFESEDAEDWVPMQYPYAKCPENFLEEYNNRMFTFTGEKQDTRSKKLCDNYGDYPEMHYTDEWEFAPDTQLLVMDSAQRGERCWLFVQAQSAIKAPEDKPEFYMEFENEDNWVPTEGYAGCPPSGLGYEDAHDECDFPGEYACEEAGGGGMMSQICCGSGETGNLHYKTCTEGCDTEDTKMCFEDI